LCLSGHGGLHIERYAVSQFLNDPDLARRDSFVNTSQSLYKISSRFQISDSDVNWELINNNVRQLLESLSSAPALSFSMLSTTSVPSGRKHLIIKRSPFTLKTVIKVPLVSIKKYPGLHVVVHNFNPSTRQVKAEGSQI
jgi:hypothetical protein